MTLRRRSIAARWFYNSFSIVAVLLIILDIVTYFLIRNYYYGAVRQYIETQANIVAGVVERIAPEYLVHELSESDMEEKIRLVRAQNALIR